MSTKLIRELASPRMKEPKPAHVASLLYFIDLNPTHYAAWLPDFATPDTVTHFAIGGKQGRKQVVSATARVALSMVKASRDPLKSGRMYIVTDKGKAYIKKHLPVAKAAPLKKAA
jgi:hypothetical protein